MNVQKITVAIKPIRSRVFASVLAMFCFACLYLPMQVFSILMIISGLEWHSSSDPQAVCSIDKTDCYGPRPMQVVVYVLCIVAGILLAAWAGQAAGRFSRRPRTLFLLIATSLAVTVVVDVAAYFIFARHV